MNAEQTVQPGLGPSAVAKGSGDAPQAGVEQAPKPPQTPDRPTEYGGRKSGLEPTRYGDWEKDGRCIDF